MGLAHLSRGVRVLLAAAVTFGVGSLLVTAEAAAADARKAELPAALDRVTAIKRIYPDLYRRELARKAPTSWNRLRRAARTQWMRQHPCSDATLNRRYELGEQSWSIVKATWACDGVPASTQSFLSCIADHEGGRTAPDVWYGGRRGRELAALDPDDGGYAGTDRVVNHFQTRPYHARKVAPEVAGRDMVVTVETFGILTHPVNAARIAVRVGRGAYATAELCS